MAALSGLPGTNGAVAEMSVASLPGLGSKRRLLCGRPTSDRIFFAQTIFALERNSAIANIIGGSNQIQNLYR